jgi:hypothetical protein
MLSVIMPNVLMLSVIMLNVVMLTVANKPFILSVFMLNVIMLNVMAPPPVTQQLLSQNGNLKKILSKFYSNVTSDLYYK